PKGGWSFNPFTGPGKQGAQTDKTAEGQAGRKVEGPNNPSSTKWLGLGGKPGPGQINLNLTHQSVVASIGEDKLRKERTADGERRLTAHRGSWKSSNFDRWRSAIENYVTSVKAGNQTALNAARVPFATYLNGIHNRIHPIFAESFLDSLAGLPPTHPLNNKNMHTNLEIVLTKEGKIVKMGITRTSGVTAFDIAALDAVERASPFGPAPGAILSTDGNVYLHWEFHRDEVFACSTMNARPFMLNVPGNAGEPEMPPAGPKPSEGEAPSGARHGSLGTRAPARAY
ncbi:MAG: TonB family protein, partial [Proteobacteria bacterium]